MKPLFIGLILFLAGNEINARDSTETKWNFGIEQDLLPYVTGGYFAAAWIGKDHVRVRALTAKVYKPDFVVKDGYTNNNTTAYAVTIDYFLKKQWKGWWIAAGGVYWKNSIQTIQQQETARFESWLLNGSMGYNFTLYKHLYVSPWAGLNLKVAGDNKVMVDNTTYTPPTLYAEASVKFGIYF